MSNVDIHRVAVRPLTVNPFFQSEPFPPGHCQRFIKPSDGLIDVCLHLVTHSHGSGDQAFDEQCLPGKKLQRRLTGRQGFGCLPRYRSGHTLNRCDLCHWAINRLT